MTVSVQRNDFNESVYPLANVVGGQDNKMVTFTKTQLYKLSQVLLKWAGRASLQLFQDQCTAVIVDSKRQFCAIISSLNDFSGVKSTLGLFLDGNECKLSSGSKTTWIKGVLR